MYIYVDPGIIDCFDGTAVMSYTTTVRLLFLSLAFIDIYFIAKFKWEVSPFFLICFYYLSPFKYLKGNITILHLDWLKTLLFIKDLQVITYLPIF